MIDTPKIAKRTMAMVVVTLTVAMLVWIDPLNVSRAQTLSEDLDSVGSSVKKTVTEVSRQLSGEDDEQTQESEATIDEIKKRLEKTANQSSPQVMGETDGADPEHRQRAVVGQIQRVSGETLTVTNNKKGNVILPISGEIVYFKDAKPAKLGDVAVGNWVSILGEMNQNQNFSPLIVSILTKFSPRTKIVILGSIQEITSKSMTIVSRAGTQEKTLTINSKTHFEDSLGQEAAAKDFSADTNVLVVGYEIIDSDDEALATATTVRALVTLEELRDDDI